MLKKIKNFVFGDYLHSLKRKKIEEALVDEILRISGLSKFNDLKVILTKLANSENELISFEFSLILKKINKGHKPKDLFLILKKKYGSDFLNKFLDLLEYSISTGSVSNQDYKNIVNDFLKSKELIEDRKSVLLMQKYTILITGGLIVPGILGVVISLVKSLTQVLDVSVIGLSGNSLLFIVAYYCSIIYILEYIIISSIYLSELDDNSKKAWVYILYLLPLSVIIFFLACNIL